MNTSECVINSPAETRRMAARAGAATATARGGGVVLRHRRGQNLLRPGGLAAGLGLRRPVTSPTFVIINEYPGPVLCITWIYTGCRRRRTPGSRTGGIFRPPGHHGHRVGRTRGRTAPAIRHPGAPGMRWTAPADSDHVRLTMEVFSVRGAPSTVTKAQRIKRMSFPGKTARCGCPCIASV